jgi:hypothetical protein
MFSTPANLIPRLHRSPVLGRPFHWPAARDGVSNKPGMGCHRRRGPGAICSVCFLFPHAATSQGTRSLWTERLAGNAHERMPLPLVCSLKARNLVRAILGCVPQSPCAPDRCSFPPPGLRFPFWLVRPNKARKIRGGFGGTAHDGYRSTSVRLSLSSLLRFSLALRREWATWPTGDGDLLSPLAARCCHGRSRIPGGRASISK